ncbi:transglutaminase family protein [Psychroserpens sp. XS_ASV72]|uniref:transglutaminase-like domain-containing protein n=1 Tax=Psychroserpens sp. XS_ASV72 TaxID=3241293 RepID=UPI0035136A48
MIKYSLVLLSFFFISEVALCQKRIEPTTQDLTLAKNLKEQYPDDDVALVTSKDDVTFGLNKREGKVTVTHIVEENMINIDSRADIQVYSFYDGESSVESFEIRYRNQKLAGFTFNDEAYTSDDLFHNDTRVTYANVDFPLKGYRYLTKLEKVYKDVKYFTKLYFNSQYPTAKKTIRVEVPDWLDLELREINFEGFDIQKQVATNKKGDGKIYTFKLNDIPAMYDEEATPGPTYIYPHILVLPKSYSVNGEVVNIFKDTQDLYDWYRSLVTSLENDNSAFKDKVRELTENATSDEEKIKNIYYWVQDNIRYIAFEDGIAGFKPDEASNVFNKRYGDCKGMANLTKQMLVEAGFDARLTWIGTKRIAYDYSTPNLSVDNHMICTLFKDGKTIFLDGTEKFNAFGEYADRIQGKQVLIENGDDYILEFVPSVEADFNKEQFNYNLSFSEEAIVGKADKVFNGESRSGLLYYFNNLKNDKKDEFLEYYLNKGNSNIKVSNIATSDLLNRDDNINIAYDIKVENAVSSFDDQIYIDLDFEKQLSNFNFKERFTDYIFSSKKDLEATTRLEIPQGYHISHLPENISVSSDNFDMDVQFSKDNNTIIYKKRFQIKNAKIETSDFEKWNNFIDQLNNLYNEQIILTKD